MIQRRTRMVSQYCRSLEIQLPGTLFVTIQYLSGFLLQSDRLKQVKSIEKARRGKE